MKKLRSNWKTLKETLENTSTLTESLYNIYTGKCVRKEEMPHQQFDVKLQGAEFKGTLEIKVR